jgi:NAD+ diphosphatase
MARPGPFWLNAVMTHITLSGNPLDRAHHKRLDVAWLESARASTRTRIVLFADGKPLVRDGAVAFLTQRALDALGCADEPVLFMGIEEEDAYFALDVTGGPAAAAAELGTLPDFRMAMGSLPAPEAAILAEARGLLNWHARHRFCANCGTPSVIADAGWKRICPACKAEHFPRTDPVVIMLAVRGSRALLGRQPQFPPGLYTTLAGFMEPGETIEEAVAREILEESGIRVGGARYVASQPWPFPSSLMIGCIAEATSETITIDPSELEDARWFTRDEIADALPRKFGEGTLFVPPPFAIAHQLIKHWVEA